MDHFGKFNPSDLVDKRITIIGGAGFLARELVKQLLEIGCLVTVADIHPAVKSNELPPALLQHKKEFRNNQLTLSFVDVVQPKTFGNIHNDTAKIAIMAAHFKFWPIDMKKSWGINVDGTKNILEYCLNHDNVDTVLYYSSIEAIGSKKQRAHPPGAKEHERPNPRELKGCPYKMTKTVAHKIAENFSFLFQERNKKIIMRAPPTAFGPGMENVPTGNIMTKHRGLIKWISPKTILSCANTRDIARDDVLMLTGNGRIKNGKTYVSVGFHASIPEILKAKEKFTRIKAPKFILPNFTLLSIAYLMEINGKIDKRYQPEMTREQAIRTTQDHFYDTVFTRDALELSQKDYLGLEETIEHTSKYLIHQGIIPNLI